MVTQDIKDKLTDFMAKGDLRYDVIEGYEFEESTIFAIDQIDRAMLDDAEDLIFKTDAKKRRAIHKYYKFDVPGEKIFAKRLEEDPEVLLYTKLKKGGFVIDTPYGEYSPDWAVIRQGNEGKAKLFFIVETKIDKKERDLSDLEKTKIKCGKLHFRAVADDVEFKWAQNYDHFLEKIGVS
jgi:type III restriction enzyme